MLRNDAYVVSHLAVLIPKKKLDSEYLKFVFQKFHPSCLIRDYAYPSITITEIESFKIPYFEDEKNRYRIATLLSRVESLIARRKKSITDLDELLKSTFLEMFGDPVRNEMGWEKKYYGKLLKSFRMDPFGSNLKTSHYESFGIRVIRLNNVGVWEFLDNDKAYVNIDHYEKVLKKYTCYSGDIIIATMGTPNIRACAVPHNIDKSINKADCVLCRPKKNIVNSSYLLGLLNLPQFLFLAAKLFHGQTRTRISMGQLAKILIPIPPLPLQNQFAEIVEKVETLKAKYKNNLNDLETLFGALSQKAFKGELDLSRIPLAVHLKPKDITTAKPYVGEPTLTVLDKPVKTSESREQILHQLFKTFLSGSQNKSITLDDFWPEAEEKFLDLMDEDAPPLGVADYDRVRDLLFEMLASGKVAQVFNEQENRMEIREVS
nr:hypothetical protein [Desulfobacula sp.]